MRNRQMVVRWLMANAKAIEERTRDGKTYYVLTDPKAFREGVGRLLAEVQRIKSEGDYPAAKQLFETYGVHFDPKLRDEVVARVDRPELAFLHRVRDAQARARQECVGRNHRGEDFVSDGSLRPDARVRVRDSKPPTVTKR